MKYISFFILLLGIYLLNAVPESDSDRAPRIDAPPVTSPISVVVPSLDLGAVLQTLASINCKIGNVNQDVCEDTILSVLGDACSILGISISQALELLLECCDATTVDFSGVFTVLQDIKDTLTECCADMQANFCDPIFIRQTDFDPAGSTPYVINSPGVYKFAEDITYNPAVSGTSAITINSSDVVLDLQCFTLTQGTPADSTTAITINAGTTDFEIQEGRIVNFNGLNSRVIFIDTGCSRFKVHDLEGVNVRLFMSLQTASQGTLSNLRQTASPSVVGMFVLLSCSDIHLNDISFNQNGSSSTSVTAFDFNACARCIFENIEVNGNTPISTFLIFNMSSNTFCLFKDISLIGSQVAVSFIGFNIAFNNVGNEFYRCMMANNRVTGVAGGTFFSGISCTTGSNDNLFVDCQVYNNSTSGNGGGAFAYAFNIENSARNTFRRCIARQNTAPNATRALPNFGAYGFNINAVTNSLFQGCLTEDQDTGASSNAVGFFVSAGSNNVLQDCQSYRQDFGFRLNPALSTAHVFVRNIAGKNTTNYSQFPVGSNQNAADITNINGSLTVPWTNIGIN